MLRNKMIFFRLFALSFVLLLMPAPIFADITIMHDLDVSEEASEPAIHQRKLMLPDVMESQKTPPASSRVFDLEKGASDAFHYKLNAGDAIAIRVFGEESLNIDVELDGTGVVNYPFLGKIFVAGLSVNSLTQLIASGLKDGYLNNPQVNVSIVKYRPFYVAGQVNAPGSYAYKPGLNVNKAVLLAGGFSALANMGDISIVYEGQSKKESIDIVSNTEVHPGDIIIIGEVGYFFIDGEVRNPGRYVFQSGLTLRKAIALAAGFTERSARGKISIISVGSMVEKKGRMNGLIESGDSITIKESLF